jgi:ribosomal protein S18 acetylase RimI-like enzyme
MGSFLISISGAAAEMPITPRNRIKMSLSIRQAKPGDEPIIVTLIRELAETSGDSSPITEEYAATCLAFPGSHVLLAEEDGQVIGLVSYSVRPGLYHAGDSGLIEELVVHDSGRGRGIGSALMSELLQQLAAAGCAEVSVSTATDNEGAKRFYKSHGLVDEAVFLEKHF